MNNDAITTHDAQSASYRSISDRVRALALRDDDDVARDTLARIEQLLSERGA